MYDTNKRIDEALNKLTDNEKYELMKELESKNSMSINTNFIGDIVNVALDITTIVAKLFHII